VARGEEGRSQPAVHGAERVGHGRRRRDGTAWPRLDRATQGWRRAVRGAGAGPGGARAASACAAALGPQVGRAEAEVGTDKWVRGKMVFSHLI
jgi:hypothetical protein